MFIFSFYLKEKMLPSCFPIKKEARKPELELRTLFIKQKMDSQGYVVLDVKELQQNDGKKQSGSIYCHSTQ